MSLPWNEDQDVNVFTNEYNQQLSVNRALSRLLDNDLYIMANVGEAIQLSGDITTLFDEITGTSLYQSTSGYHKWPGDFALQWGKQSINANTVATITLPTTFTTILSVLGSYDGTSTALDGGSVATSAVNGSTIKITNGAQSTQSIKWQALGKY